MSLLGYTSGLVFRAIVKILIIITLFYIISILILVEIEVMSISLSQSNIEGLAVQGLTLALQIVGPTGCFVYILFFLFGASRKIQFKMFNTRNKI